MTPQHIGAALGAALGSITIAAASVAMAQVASTTPSTTPTTDQTGSALIAPTPDLGSTTSTTTQPSMSSTTQNLPAGTVGTSTSTAATSSGNGSNISNSNTNSNAANSSNTAATTTNPGSTNSNTSTSTGTQTGAPGVTGAVVTIGMGTTTDVATLQQEIVNLEARVTALENDIAILWAVLNQSGMTNVSGSAPSTTGTAMNPAIDQQGGTYNAGDVIDFGGHGFPPEQQITITQNGMTVGTAHSDGGGNFSTGTLRVPMTSGTYTYTFTVQGSTAVTATITVR